jgi:hypothetical protein
VLALVPVPAPCVVASSGVKYFKKQELQDVLITEIVEKLREII